MKVYPNVKTYGNVKSYTPYFQLVSVPDPLYEKGVYDITIRVSSGLPFELYINDILAGSGIGTGSNQDVSVTILNSMISASSIQVRLSGLRTKTSLVTCWGPSLITSILTHHDDQGAYTDGVGWVATYGAPTLTSTAYPTITSRNSRRTLTFNGSTQFLKATFTRNQPSETWFAGKWIGNVVSGNKTIVSGAASGGQIYRTLNDNNISLFAGSTLSAATATSIEDVWIVVGAVFNGASSQAYLGVTGLGVGNAGATAPGGLTIGQSGSATNYANCEVGEVITTNNLTSAQEKIHIVGYLNKVWGI